MIFRLNEYQARTIKRLEKNFANRKGEYIFNGYNIKEFRYYGVVTPKGFIPYWELIPD